MVALVMGEIKYETALVCSAINGFVAKSLQEKKRGKQLLDISIHI